MQRNLGHQEELLYLFFPVDSIYRLYDKRSKDKTSKEQKVAMQKVEMTKGRKGKQKGLKVKNLLSKKDKISLQANNFRHFSLSIFFPIELLSLNLIYHYDYVLLRDCIGCRC